MSAEPGPLDDDARDPTARRQAWSRYWASGVLHSCPGYGERYGGPIADFWKEVFADLGSRGRVLDVATGNGVLPRMLLEQCRTPEVTCDAVDIAAVQPPWLAKVSASDASRVRFHGGVDAAALPFEEGCFDLVMSQYGLEYTELERTVPEVLRVLAPGGAMAMVLHHAQGRPVTLAGIEIEHARWLDRKGGWFEATQALVEPMARAATAEGRASLKGDQGANAARERFNEIQNQLTARAGDSDGADVLFEVRESAMRAFELAGRDGAPAAMALLASLRVDLVAGVTRLLDLRDHAMGDDQARALCERLANALGRPVALGVLHEVREGHPHVMGWSVRVSSLG